MEISVLVHHLNHFLSCLTRDRPTCGSRTVTVETVVVSLLATTVDQRYNYSFLLCFIVCLLFAAIHNRFHADKSSTDVPLGLVFKLVYGTGSVEGTISDETLSVYLTDQAPHSQPL